ncbi:MAG: fimbria major subunit [Bacteroides sp.]|nr:fimbria major subunit [Bacteroides sp.]
MIRLQDIFITLFGSIALLAMPSCVMEKYEDCPADPTPEEQWITLQFVMSGESAVTRANPVGGEDGNGKEVGILNENKIHDVNIFLHTNATSLLNAENDTPLTHLYFNLDNLDDPENTLEFEKEQPSDDAKDDNSKIIYTIKFKNPLEEPGNPLRDLEGNLRFITVANFGSSMKGMFKTLTELRNYNLDKTWTGTETNVEKYDRFIMTTAYDNTATSGDSYLDLSPNRGFGSKEKPYYGSTKLERMCARLEVMYDRYNLSEDKSKLIYSVEDTDSSEENNTLATVNILNILPVNVMSEPSYLFKKVTDGVPTTWTIDPDYKWGGREETINDIPSNYIIEPHTLDKEKGDNEVATWYGDTRASLVYYNIANEDYGKVSDYYHGDLPKTVFEKNTKMTILGYANENTQSPKLFNKSFITGIAFRAVYVPESIYVGFTEKNVDGNTTTMFTPIDSNDNPTSIYRYSPSKTTQLEKDCIYFSNQDAVQKYQAAHPEDSPEITKFTAEKCGGKWGFICYYNLWLRHYNDETADPQRDYPMEYATVRNNIYRVSISFNGPGDPSPTMREPDTMQARIFVRKWNFRPQPEIIM